MRLFRDPVWRGSLVVLLRHYAAYAVALAFGSRGAGRLGALGSHRSSTPPTSRWSGASSTPCPPPLPRTSRDGSGPRCRTGPRRGSRTRSPRRWPRWRVAVRPQEIRQPVSYLNPRDKAAPYVVNPATGERTPGVVFDATGALDALVPAPGSPEPGAHRPVAARHAWPPGCTSTPATRSGSSWPSPGGDPAPTAATVTGVYVTDADGAPEDRTGLWGRLTDELPDLARATSCRRRRSCRCWSRTPTPTGPWSAGIGELIARDLGRGARRRTRRGSRTSARLYDSADALREELKNPRSDLREQVKHRGANPVTLSTGLPAMVAETRAGLRATDEGVAAVRVLAAGLSWLVVALAAVALLVRRRGERQVLVEQGRSSLELTALSLVEAVLPVGLGLLAGWWASPPVRRPPSWATAEWRPDRATPSLVGGVVLATVGVASAADALARHRRASGRTVVSASRIPWRSAVLALAGAGAISAYRGRLGVRRGHGGLPARGGGRRGDRGLDGGHRTAGAAGPALAAAPARAPARPCPGWRGTRRRPPRSSPPRSRSGRPATACCSTPPPTTRRRTRSRPRSAPTASSASTTRSTARRAGRRRRRLDRGAAHRSRRINGFTGDRLFAVDAATFARGRALVAAVRRAASCPT